MSATRLRERGVNGVGGRNMVCHHSSNNTERLAVRLLCMVCHVRLGWPSLTLVAMRCAKTFPSAAATQDKNKTTQHNTRQHNTRPRPRPSHALVSTSLSLSHSCASLYGITVLCSFSPLLPWPVAAHETKPPCPATKPSLCRNFHPCLLTSLSAYPCGSTPSHAHDLLSQPPAPSGIRSPRQERADRKSGFTFLSKRVGLGGQARHSLHQLEEAKDGNLKVQLMESSTYAGVTRKNISALNVFQGYVPLCWI